MKGFYSVSVNANWRVIFQFKGKDAVLVDYLDYHQDINMRSHMIIDILPGLKTGDSREVTLRGVPVSQPRYCASSTG